MGNKITRTSFRLPEDDYQAFAILARQRRRSIGEAVLEAMHMWMDASTPPSHRPSIATKTDGVIPNSPKLQRRIESILSGRNTTAERLMLAALEAAEELTDGNLVHHDSEHPDVTSVAEALSSAAAVEGENSRANESRAEDRKPDQRRNKQRSVG